MGVRRSLGRVSSTCFDHAESEALLPLEKRRRVLSSAVNPGICFTVVRKTEGLSWEVKNTPVSSSV